jgi:hypothetical protein
MDKRSAGLVGRILLREATLRHGYVPPFRRRTTPAGRSFERNDHVE